MRIIGQQEATLDARGRCYAVCQACPRAIVLWANSGFGDAMTCCYLTYRLTMNPPVLTISSEAPAYV